MARWKETVSARQLGLPSCNVRNPCIFQFTVVLLVLKLVNIIVHELASESVLGVGSGEDGESERQQFRCYMHWFVFIGFEVCPVLLVKVEEQPNGCCIISCPVRYYSVKFSVCDG